LAVPFAFLLAVALAPAQNLAHPLRPPDLSSPRATLKTFLDSADAVGEFLARDYLPAPSPEQFRRLSALVVIPQHCMDLSQLPPAARVKQGRAAATALYEALSRITLPPLEAIPGVDQIELPEGKALARWVIPNTEIAIVRVQDGPHSGEYRFSADTVARAFEFHERVRALAYTRSVPLENLHDVVVMGGGWMVPYPWVLSLPEWLRTPLAEQAVWKWIGLALLTLVLSLVLWLAYRMSRLGSQRRPFLQALAQLTMPASVLAVAPAFAYLALVQINLIEGVGSAVALAVTAAQFLAGAWLSWRMAPVVAEAIISSPKIGPQSIDAHLIRVSARLLGIVGGMVLLATGADRLGVPVYGIVAGLGVGGLAIALAAQPTIENLIGGMNLFADRPIRVGDFLKYGDEIGTVEAIGIRSTRIRGNDRTVTTIPNAALAKMPIVNFTRRDRMLIHSTVGLRYETTPEQLRHVLAKLREMLLGHPRIHPEPARARLIGLGGSSLDVEIFAYAATNDWNEFLGIREDVLMRVMDIVAQSGTAFAFPSRTLYIGRDHGVDEGKAQAAEAEVRAWRDAGALPFPNFSPQQAKQLRGSVVYPPVGSAAAASPRPSPAAPSG
jgi:MscS family membrane protein